MIKPIGYEVINHITTFIYDDDEYKDWIALGEKDGNIGTILWSISRETDKPIFITRKGFGTIENPVHTEYTISIIHNAFFDNGELGANKEIFKGLHKPLTNFFENCEMMFIDLSGKTNVIKKKDSDD